MATGVAGLLAFFGIVTGTIGVFFFGLLALMLTVVLFGSAIMAVAGEVDARLARLAGGAPTGWSPTCPGCGLDLTGPERVCPHCGRALVPEMPPTR